MTSSWMLVLFMINSLLILERILQSKNSSSENEINYSKIKTYSVENNPEVFYYGCPKPKISSIGDTVFINPTGKTFKIQLSVYSCI
jgi:hypothetical protein